jgi:hypothetical protein
MDVDHPLKLLDHLFLVGDLAALRIETAASDRDVSIDRRFHDLPSRVSRGLVRVVDLRCRECPASQSLDVLQGVVGVRHPARHENANDDLMGKGSDVLGDALLHEFHVSVALLVGHGFN